MMFYEDVVNAMNIYDIAVSAYLSLGSYCVAKTKGYIITNFPDITFIYSQYSQEISKHGAFSSFKGLLLELLNDHEFSNHEYIAIIESTDWYISYEYKTKSNLDMQYKSYSSLNKLNAQTSIIPIVKNTMINTFNISLAKHLNLSRKESSNLGLRKKKEYQPHSINSKMKNLMFNETGKSEYTVLFHELIADEFSEIISETKKMSIAVFPLICMFREDVLNISIDHSTFIVESLVNETEKCLCDRYIYSICESKRRNIDIAIFPEMLLSENILKKIQTYIIAEDSSTFPKIIVLGTIWGNMSNICVVLTNYGKIIFKQSKKTPFLYGKSYECLDKKDPIIHIIDINGIGRIFTLICRDIDNSEITNLCKNLLADIILLPSYSDSLDLAPSANSLAELHNCITIMSNTCTAFVKSREDCSATTLSNANIGFVSIPAIQGAARTSETIYYSRDDSCKNCLSNCIGKDFEFQFDEVDQKPNNLCTIKVI